MTIENLIKSKGFEDVIVSASSGSINVIVETAGLTNSEVAQIVDVVKNNSDYSIDNIKITEVLCRVKTVVIVQAYSFLTISTAFSTAS